MSEQPPRIGPDTAAITAPSDNTTLTVVLADYARAGFTAQFGIDDDDGRVRCFTCGTETAPSSLTMDSLRRLEGASDPADMLSVVALTCACGASGTAVLHFGPESSRGEAVALDAFEDLRCRAGVPGSMAPYEAEDGGGAAQGPSDRAILVGDASEVEVPEGTVTPGTAAD